jgi:hypothetical protein
VSEDLIEELINFVRQQINEDERLAREAGGTWHQTDPERETGRIEDESGEVVVYDEGSPNGWQAEHIARHDPARVLREVDSLRRVIELMAAQLKSAEVLPPGHREAAAARARGALQLLAAIFADRPGFREEWRPQ